MLSTQKRDIYRMGEITDYLNLKDYEVDGADLIALISNLNH